MCVQYRPLILHEVLVVLDTIVCVQYRPLILCEVLVVLDTSVRPV